MAGRFGASRIQVNQVSGYRKNLDILDYGNRMGELSGGLETLYSASAGQAIAAPVCDEASRLGTPHVGLYVGL